MPAYYFFHCSQCDFKTHRYRNFRVCPKCGSQMIREEPPDLRCACYGCGTMDKLEMLAHRNPKGQMVGWLFVCRKCKPAIAGRSLSLDPDPDAETLRLAEQSPAYTTGADGD